MSSSSTAETSARCVELALDGESKCRSGDTKAGIELLESALTVGTDDLRTLSAIYSQLGNAFFYQGDYLKAWEYHRHDLTLARTIGDKVGEAKASGNLGNTLKVLGKFDEAILCCQRHLDISRELTDKVGEGRALYNLGNVLHAKGKYLGRLLSNSSTADSTSFNGSTNSSEFSADVSLALSSAVKFYEDNLLVVNELGDRAAEGRACGNLGNSHYLLGQFDRAIYYHDMLFRELKPYLRARKKAVVILELTRPKIRIDIPSLPVCRRRLQIAKEFGDKVAMRRAYSNLGNAHVFLGDFVKAAECYKRALAIALELSDRATEAQACYSLGNTCTLIGDHQQAVEYHLRHLCIARDLKDRVGQSRASWSLGNAFTALGHHKQALYFVLLHRHLSKEIGDQNGQLVADQNLTDLGRIVGPIDDCVPDASPDPQPVNMDDLLPNRDRTRPASECGSSKPRRRRSMERIQPWHVNSSYAQSNNCSATGLTKKHQSISSDSLAIKTKPRSNRDSSNEDESFMDMLARVQGKRIDDQRCDASAISSEKENRPRVRAHDGFRQDNKRKLRRMSLSLADSIKRGGRSVRRRMSIAFTTAPPKSIDLSDVGSEAESPAPSVFSDPSSIAMPLDFSVNSDNSAGVAVGQAQTREEFWDMILGIQGRRMDDQRAQLPFLPGLQNAAVVLGPHIRRQSLQNEPVSRGEPGAGIAPPISKEQSKAGEKESLDDDFIEMLIRCQSTRIEEQRSELPEPEGGETGGVALAPVTPAPPKLCAPTVPDEDFFSLIMRMQGRRFDEQRAPLVKKKSDKLSSAGGSSPAAPESGKQSHKRTASQKLKNKK